MALMLNIVFTVFLSFITLTLSCPDGFIVRNTGDSFTCCKAKNCTQNEGYTLCNGTERNPGEDQCYKCPPGQINLDKTDTRQMTANLPLCHWPDCQCSHEGTAISNPKECGSGKALKVCECNKSAGYYGFDPNNCYKADGAVISTMRQPGYELTDDGKVRRCKPGYFKSSSDTSVCKPQKLCLVVKVPGSPTHDNICLTMDKPTTLDVPNSHENTTFPVSNSTEPNGEDQIYIPIIVIVVTVAILIIAGVLLWRCGFFRRIFSTENGENLPNQSINDEERAQVPSLSNVESSGIYDEIGLARRLLEQADRIHVPCDTESHLPVDIHLNEEENPFISRQSAPLDGDFSTQNSFSLLSQDSEDTNGAQNDNTSLKMSISGRGPINPCSDANPVQEDTPGKVYPGATVVTEVDMINKISG